MIPTIGKGDIVLDILRDILIQELGLEEDRVNIYNQRFAIPPDEHLFITLEKEPATIISSRNYTDPNGTGLQEIQEINTHETVIIGIFSRNLEALRRKEEVVMAIHSIYSQQAQEANSFKIYSHSPITNLSMLEGSAQLYRFDFLVHIHAWYQKIKTADYYDKYTGKVDTNSLIKVSFVQPSSSSSSSSRSSSSSSSSKSSSSTSVSSSSSSLSSSSSSMSSSSSSSNSSSSSSSSISSSSSSRSSSSSSSRSSVSSSSSSRFIY